MRSIPDIQLSAVRKYHDQAYDRESSLGKSSSQLDDKAKTHLIKSIHTLSSDIASINALENSRDLSQWVLHGEKEVYELLRNLMLQDISHFKIHAIGMHLIISSVAIGGFLGALGLFADLLSHQPKHKISKDESYEKISAFDRIFKNAYEKASPIPLKGAKISVDQKLRLFLGDRKGIDLRNFDALRNFCRAAASNSLFPAPQKLETAARKFQATIETNGLKAIEEMQLFSLFKKPPIKVNTPQLIHLGARYGVLCMLNHWVNARLEIQQQPSSN